MLSPSKVVKTSVSAMQLAEAVLGQIAGAAAGLAAALDRLVGVPGGDRLEAGGARLELAPRPLLFVGLLGGAVVGAEDPVELGDHALLREVERVGAGERGQEAALVDAVVEKRHLRLRSRAGRTGARRSRVADRRSSAPPWSREIEAPPTLIRPWMRVPSIVKKRRSSFSIGLK